jgi:hypothetical protein
MSETQAPSARTSSVVTTATEFDRFVAECLPDLLDRATAQARRFLRETGQWTDDISHEKLALRWGYELVERFLVFGRSEVPCRPFFLLDSHIAKFYSQPDPLCYHKDLLSPLGRWLSGLVSRSVISRDALMTLFYHLYGFSQAQVVKVLGFGLAESQRVYKNFERWRQGGWQRALDEMGMVEDDLREIELQRSLHPERVNAEADRLIGLLQTHYRKSEPAHYACSSRRQWDDLFREDFGHDYRVWHLALCRDCLLAVCELRREVLNGASKLCLDLHLYPPQKGKATTFFVSKEGALRNGTARSTRPIPRPTA